MADLAVASDPELLHFALPLRRASPLVHGATAWLAWSAALVVQLSRKLGGRRQRRFVVAERVAVRHPGVGGVVVVFVVGVFVGRLQDDALKLVADVDAIDFKGAVLLEFQDGKPPFSAADASIASFATRCSNSVSSLLRLFVAPARITGARRALSRTLTGGLLTDPFVLARAAVLASSGLNGDRLYRPAVLDYRRSPAKSPAPEAAACPGNAAIRRDGLYLGVRR